MIKLIVAVDKNYGIGKNNSLPWNITEDMKYFKEITLGSGNNSNVVIMGRNTWESIPKKFRPLSNRINIIISSTVKLEYCEQAVVFKTLNEAYFYCFNKLKNINDIFIIGGKRLYEESFRTVQNLYITYIDHDYNCDIKLKDIAGMGKLVTQHTLSTTCTKIKKNLNISFLKYVVNINTEEFNYLKLLKDILEKKCSERITRNGKTFSSFGKQLKFDVSSNFPLLTTKKMFLRGIIEELLFFIRGDTNSNLLSEKKVRIWEGNTTREFLDNRGLNNYKSGDMGPMYGWQWRHYGAEYKGMEYNYDNIGFDQLKEVIRLIKEDPTSRRIMMTTFNPVQLKESVLAPCHSLILQFYVDGGNLSCHMYQRSADLFLGVPFNISSTTILLYIIAHVTNLKPKDVIISFGDVHIYEDHLEQSKQQIERYPYVFPKLEIKKNIDTNNINKMISFMENLDYSDFKLSEYKFYSRIKAKMVA